MPKKKEKKGEKRISIQIVFYIFIKPTLFIIVTEIVGYIVYLSQKVTSLPIKCNILL